MGSRTPSTTPPRAPTRRRRRRTAGRRFPSPTHSVRTRSRRRRLSRRRRTPPILPTKSQLEPKTAPTRTFWFRTKRTGAPWPRNPKRPQEVVTPTSLDSKCRSRRSAVQGLVMAVRRVGSPNGYGLGRKGHSSRNVLGRVRTFNSTTNTARETRTARWIGLPFGTH